jgi:hypothetical protein
VSTRPVPPRKLWWLLAGFGVWCSALVVIYALHAIGCAFAWPAGPLRLTIAVVLLAHLGVIAWMWRDHAAGGAGPDPGPTGTFLRTVGAWSVIAALATIVLTLGPTIALRTCV